MAAITLDALVIEGGIFEVVVRDGVLGRLESVNHGQLRMSDLLVTRRAHFQKCCHL